MIQNLGYGETMNAGHAKRRDVRWVAQCSKATFLRTYLKFDPSKGTLTWVKARLGRTWNDYELELIGNNAGQLVCYDKRTYEVLYRLPLITSRVKV